MTAATMFSGIGAPEVAMPRWRWPWHAEIEKFPSAVMAARHPDSINLGDVTADDFCERAAAVCRPDVLVFGSPCQSYSIAGKRLGLDDPRGNLALVALGIVDRLKPDWFVFENVPGLLSSSGGRDFGLFLRTVDEIRYSGAWASLDAQWFGVAQRRERLFFVGHIGDWRGPAAVLFEPESLCGHSPPRRQAGEKPAPTIASRPTGGGGLDTDFDCDGGLIAGTLNANGKAAGSATSQDAESGMLVAYGGNNTEGAINVATACNAHGGSGRMDFESETFIAHALRADGFDASEDGTGRGTPLVPTLAFSCKDHGADASPLAPTLRAMGHSGSHANAGGQVAVLTSTVRRLTPRECERLQGFPDDYTQITYRGKPSADGPRYKSLGNSKAVPVIRWILSRIEQVALKTSEGMKP